MAFFRNTGPEIAALAGSRTDPRVALYRWIARKRASLAREPRALNRVAKRRLPPRGRILTISRSSAVRGLLLSLPTARRPREVIALRSRPGGEGATLCRELAAGGIRSRLIEDSAVGALHPRPDLVLLGADSILADGSVVHKLGTRRLVRQAGRWRVPVVVAAGGSKFLQRASTRARVSPGFDRTPARWITEVWSNAGILKWHPRAGRESGEWRRVSPKTTLDTM